MKANGYYEISDVPALLKRGGMVGMIAARGALLDAAEQIAGECESSGRAMTREERTAIAEHMARIDEISADIVAYKSAAGANNDTGLPVTFPF